VVGAATDKFAILALTAGLTQTVPIAPRKLRIVDLPSFPHGTFTFSTHNVLLSIENSALLPLCLVVPDKPKLDAQLIRAAALEHRNNRGIWESGGSDHPVQR
jgi:hypothetical protein